MIPEIFVIISVYHHDVANQCLSFFHGTQGDFSQILETERPTKVIQDCNGNNEICMQINMIKDESTST